MGLVKTGADVGGGWQIRACVEAERMWVEAEEDTEGVVGAASNDGARNGDPGLGAVLES